MKIISGKQPRPRRILLYGQHGVGKSTWAAAAPSPIFLDIEGGLGDIDCHRTEKLNSFGSVCAAVSWFTVNDSEHRTLVIDTLDWLEKLIFAQVAIDAGKATIADIGFGKGYVDAASKWDFLLNELEKARQRGKGIILLAHAKITRFENPETAAYDRYELDLHKSSNSMVQEWCDEVLFASFRVFTRTEDQGFGKDRTIAIGGKERFIRTNESAAAVAKSRLRLPDELPMEWSAYAKYLAPAAPAAVAPAAVAPAAVAPAAVAPAAAAPAAAAPAAAAPAATAELAELAARFDTTIPAAAGNGNISKVVVDGSSRYAGEMSNG